METIHLYNLSTLCRVCLSKTEEMTNLFDTTRGFCELFKATVNIELEKNEAFPNYLCSNCIEKILICKEFIYQFKKTNELLARYKACDFKIQEDTKVQLESLPVTEIVKYVSEDENSDGSKGSDEPVHAKNLRKFRLEQYSYEEVLQAIEDRKQKFNSNRTCIKCNFESISFRALSVHMSFMHKDLKDKWCKICNVVFDDLKEHSKIHDQHGNKCQFCSKNLSTRGHLVEHLWSHTTVRPYQCTNCDKTFVSMRHLRIHCRTHTREKPYNCDHCESTFSQSYSLKLHFNRYHNELVEYHCVHCKTTFNTEASLRVHKCLENASIVTNTMRQNFCSICNENVRSLAIHNKNIHENNIKINASPAKLCTVCGKQFKNSSKLKVHMRIHTGETPYSCSHCDRKMSTRHHLVLHERTHTHERPHVCRICNKGFAQSGNLNTHMKLHTGRSEHCMICAKTFCRPAQLRLHMRKHTGEKPFVCQYCGKGFIQKSHLVEHSRRHSDDRPFTCTHCGRSFRQRSSLKTHVQIHLGQKPFKCSQCTYACRQSYSLTIHMKQHVGTD